MLVKSVCLLWNTTVLRIKTEYYESPLEHEFPGDCFFSSDRKDWVIRDWHLFIFRELG